MWLRFSLGLLCLAALPLQAQNASPPVAHYPFAGDADDVSGQARDGVALGATLTTDRFGEPNGAYAFGEDAAIYLGHALSTIALPFAVSAWVYHDGPVAHIANVMSSNESGDTYTGFWLQVHDTGELELSYGDGGPRSYASRRSKLSSTSVASDRWVHVVGVARSATDMTLYVDGQDAYGTYDGTGGALVSSLSPGFIGFGDEAVRQNTWTGKIDDVRVYDRALSDEEVAALFIEEGGSVQAEEAGTAISTHELQVYPNPLTYTALVRIDLVQAQHLRAELLDVVGRQVLVLYDGWADRGESRLSLRGAGLAPGTYMLRVEADGRVQTQQVVVR